MLVSKVFSQNHLTDIYYKIDSLESIGQPDAALKEINKLDKAEYKQSLAVKNLIYKIRLMAYMKKDAMADILNLLKSEIEKAKFPEKQIFESLLGSFYFQYYKVNFYSINQRNFTDYENTDFTFWNGKRILNEAEKYYISSLSPKEQLFAIPVEQLSEMLNGDSKNRVLRPQLYDLLLHRALDFYLSQDVNHHHVFVPDILKDSSVYVTDKDFVAVKFKQDDHPYIKGFMLLQEASKLHQEKANFIAVADLDVRRLKFLKSINFGLDKYYTNSLEKIAKLKEAGIIQADALHLLAELNYQIQDYKNASRYYKSIIEKFPESGNKLEAVKELQKLSQVTVSTTLEEYQLPNEPILFLLKYRNIKRFKVSIYKSDIELKLKQLLENPKLRAEALSYMKKMSVFKTQFLEIPIYNDYETRSTEFMLEPLPLGQYILVVENANNPDSVLSFNHLSISNLSVLHHANTNNYNFLVLNRKTGLAVANANISVKQINPQNNQILNTINGISQKDGNLTLKRKSEASNSMISVTAALGQDTIFMNRIYTYAPFQRSNSSSVEEGYRITIFTDKPIYRPGQTVYYKGVVINSKKVKDNLVQNYKNELRLRINNQDIHRDTFITNDYGSFSGSFKLPDNIQIKEALIITTDRRFQQLLQIAEYKKPSFQIFVSPQKPYYKYLDTVVYKGVIKNYAGFGVSNTKIIYDIKQSDIYINRISNMGHVKRDSKDTLIANALGEFEIKFLAKHQNPSADTELNYSQFFIKIKATDIAGETHEKNESLVIAPEPLSLRLDIKDVITKDMSEESKFFVYSKSGYSIKAKLRTELYLLQSPKSYTRERYWIHDNFFKPTLSEEGFLKYFPNYSYPSKTNELLVKDLVERTNYPDELSEGIINLKSFDHLKTGYYEIRVIAKTSSGDSVTTKSQFYYLNKQELAVSPNHWIIAENVEMMPGKKAKFSLNLSNSNVWMTIYKNGDFVSKELIEVKDKPQIIYLEASKIDQVVVDFLMVHDNRVYKKEYNLTYKKQSLNLKAEILDINEEMQAGKPQSIRAKIINDKGRPQVTEVLAVLFDASLGQLAPASNWLQSFNRAKRYNYSRNTPSWNTFHFNSLKDYHTNNFYHYPKPLLRNYESIHLGKYNYYGDFNGMFEEYLRNNKQNKMNKLQDSLIQAQYLSNLKKYKNGFDYSGRIVADNRGLAGVIISVKGTKINAISNSFGYFKVRLPEKGTLIFSYKGEKFKELSVNEPQKYQIIHHTALKKFETMYKKDISGAISSLDEVVVPSYGSPRGNEEINIRGTASISNEFVKEDVSNYIFTSVADVPVRRFFNETAFFYPHLKTNKKGELGIDFTLPESLTTWKLKLFALHKTGEATVLEKDIVSSKKLMIIPQMPRFLRVGDTTNISIRVINQHNFPVEASFNWDFYGQDQVSLNHLVIHPPKANLSLKPNIVDTIQVKIVVNEAIAALKYKFTIQSKDESDGLEEQIPVLSNKVLVTEVMPILTYPQEDATFTFQKFIQQNSNTLEHQNFIFEYAHHPSWQVLESLPYSKSINEGCPENVFSALVMNRLSSSIVKANPRLRDTLKVWATAVDKASLINGILKQENQHLAIANEHQRKAVLGSLADEKSLEEQYKDLLNKLKDAQLPDGGFPWLTGLRSDVFISQHVLVGLGKLLNRKQMILSDVSTILAKLKPFVQQQVLNNKPLHLQVHAWYALSFLNSDVSPSIKTAKENYLKHVKEHWLKYNLYQQALISTTAYREGDKELSKLINASIKDRAIRDKENGVYWANINFGCFWYELPIETQSVLISLFEETEPNLALIKDMKLWLLKHKQVNHWGNTKATAEACFALLNRTDLMDDKLPNIKIAGSTIQSLKPTLNTSFGHLAINFQKEDIKPDLGKIEISNVQQASWGAMYWQYLEDASKISSGARGLSIQRKYFVLGSKGSFEEVLPQTKLKVGDVLKVVLYLKADRDFDYVRINDLRPANTEPQDVLSKYLYKGSLFYYQVTKDKETNFYISYLHKGSYVIDYQLNISQSGVFNTGIASIESAYAPDFRGHSISKTISVK